MEKVAMLVRSFIQMGGHQMQLNAVNRETLLDAQKNPQDHQDLIVRVWDGAVTLFSWTRAIKTRLFSVPAIGGIVYDKSAYLLQAPVKGVKLLDGRFLSAFNIISLF